MIPLTDALAWLLSQAPRLPAETIPSDQAAGRVLAADVLLVARPAVPMAGIDGQAVRAASTEGAGDYAPLPLPGTPVCAGQPLPEGADAVLPATHHDGASVLAPVARGHGVVPTGHDGADGETLPAGARLRPLHLGLLGTHVAVVRRPRVLVRAAAAKAGPDTLLPLLHALLAAHDAIGVTTQPDLILHAGRSGPGPDDDGIAAFTKVQAHGIAIHPGETAALGHIGPALAVLLPGTPQDCATAFALLVAPLLRHMAGLPGPAPVPAVLARKIASGLGQTEAVRVRLHAGIATPLDGGLAALAPADGLVLVQPGSEGYPAGATVAVHLLP